MQLRILYQEKTSINSVRKIDIFSNKQSLQVLTPYTFKNKTLENLLPQNKEGTKKQKKMASSKQELEHTEVPARWHLACQSMQPP